MRAFAVLLEDLGTLQSRSRKIARMAAYFASVPDPDRGWALAALTDGVPASVLGRLPLRRMARPKALKPLAGKIKLPGPP